MKIDWSFGPGRHPVWGAYNAGVATFTLTSFAWLVDGKFGWADIPAWWPVAIGGFLALVSAAVAAMARTPGVAVAYRVGCWLGAGVWSSLTLALSESGPWARGPAITLAVGCAMAAIVGTGLARLEQEPPPPKPEPAPRVRTAEDRIAAEWEARLRRITRREVTVLGVQIWDPPTGHTLHVQLPDDGTTVGDIKAYEGSLAANLPVGCNAEVMGASTIKRECLIRVATENAMAETHHLGSGDNGKLLPKDVEPRSINDGLWVGIYADRTQATINLRYACGCLVGQTGSGKTNVLNVITHRLGQCVDALVWAIDLSGQGKFPRPWIRAWHEGRADAPVIDWAAVTLEEAELMCLAAINIINGRTATYQQLMFEANDDKIPVSADLPEIVILVDEFGTLPDKLKEMLRTISDTGRSAGARGVWCALEATATYIPRPMITQARERIGMRVTDEQQLQYLFDAQWSRGRFDPATIPYEGSGLLATGATAPLPAKALRLEPNRIDAGAIALARLRPELDQISFELGDTVTREFRDDRGEWVTEEITDVLARRWERMLPLIFPDPTRPAPPLRTVAAAGGTATLTQPRTAPRQDEEVTVNLDESAREMQRAAERARQAREAADAEQAAETDPGLEIDWTIPDGWLAEAVDEGGDRPPARVRIRQIVQDNRRDGIGPRAVWQQLQAEGYRHVEQTVIGWMRADAEAGVLAQPGGKGQPYVPGPNFTLEQT